MNKNSENQTLQELKSKIRENPEDNTLIEKLAEHFEREKQYDLAIEQYEKLLKIIEKSIKENTQKLNNVIEKKSLSEFEDRDKIIELLKFNNNILPGYFNEIENKINFCYYKQKDYTRAQKGYNKVLKKDPDNEFAKIGMAISYYKLKKNIYSYDYIKEIHRFSEDEIGLEYYKTIVEITEYFKSNGEYEKAINLYDKIDPWDYLQIYGAPLRDEISLVYKEHLAKFDEDTKIKIYELNSKIANKEIEHENEIHKVKIEERDKILSNLSHSIKNLISTVIDPLTNLKEDKQYKDIIIDNALKGADLIRKIVNAMNLSFKGSFDDFIYDAAHAIDDDSITIESIIIESLKHSISNMFDSKYFGNFMRNYFSDKKLYSEAKNDWNQISSHPQLIKFIKKHMFDIELSIDSAKNLTIGNEKGSAIKFQILFQEIILNAVKYASFVERNSRKINMKFVTKKGDVQFEVSNSYRKGEMTKTTGLGKIIIQNFCKLLRTEPEIRENEANYLLSMRFKNVWSNDGKVQ